MPFIEVYDFADQATRRPEAARLITDILGRHANAPASTVVIYFLPRTAETYAYGGPMGDDAERRRLFIKAHLLPRSPDVRRATAKALCEALSSLYAMPLEHTAVYFLERQTDEIAHGGVLESDRLIEHNKEKTQ